MSDRGLTLRSDSFGVPVLVDSFFVRVLLSVTLSEEVLGTRLILVSVS